MKPSGWGELDDLLGLPPDADQETISQSSSPAAPTAPQAAPSRRAANEERYERQREAAPRRSEPESPAPEPPLDRDAWRSLSDEAGEVEFADSEGEYVDAELAEPGGSAAEPPGEDRPRRRRRRRRRGGGGDEGRIREHRTLAGDIPLDEGPGDEFSEAREEGLSFEAVDDAGPETQPDLLERDETRGPRRRRRRRGRGKSGADSGQGDRTEERPRNDRATPSARAAEVDHGDEDVIKEWSEADDDETDDSKKIGHRNIPTWTDCVGVLIDANMESRSRSPSGGGGGSGGRTRGRGRRGRGRSG